jgi:hypothetical protein
MNGILRQRMKTRIASALVRIGLLICAASSATAQEQTIHERMFHSRAVEALVRAMRSCGDGTLRNRQPSSPPSETQMFRSPRGTTPVNGWRRVPGAGDLDPTDDNTPEATARGVTKSWSARRESNPRPSAWESDQVYENRLRIDDVRAERDFSGFFRRFLVRSDPRVTPPSRMTRVGGGSLRTPANGQPTAPPQTPRWDLT